ncbi:glycoside hydrolase family 18 protein [Lentithecium fluviatile CBS 122367]|uniref:chitinase n=1 Tax=Lentithecium fluviatile CBS 122367 TaxID=1168545 RepID=A0A6G1IPG9_9PLEO|nr:glycoside hydrolase family 18 protein [Lentithecium fluviatile CBS 122367]
MGKPRYIMYLTGQHPVVPEPALIADISHVALAFMRSETFNEPEPSSWPLFTTVEDTRPKFAQGTKVMIAIGGWGDTDNFSKAAKTEETRSLFARNVARMIEETGADGVDVDWEYPGGNGEDYKQVPNSEKEWEIAAYPSLLSSIRLALGPTKVISAAVPGLPRDLLAFTPTTIPQILDSVDFLNIMTYDLMNRRDNITKHHTGLQASRQAIEAYAARGVPPGKMNLGLAFYVKWFKTDPDADCSVHLIGCKTALMEDPTTGADLGKAGAFSWHDKVPPELNASFQRALANSVYDSVGGGDYYFDADDNLFWSWDSPDAIVRKFPAIVEKKGLGGVFAWGLGEDAPKFEHLKAANEGIEEILAIAEHQEDRAERSEL